MAQPLSMDLRTRVLSAVAEGASGRSAGRRFGVSAPSVSRWRALERAQGDAAPKAVGGDRRSRETEAHAATILLAIEATADLTLEELRALTGQGWRVRQLWRALAISRPSQDHAQKKSAHASEQERPDIVKRREDWFEGQPDLDPERLVFIDETWASTNMAAPHMAGRRAASGCAGRAARPLENDDLRRRAAPDRHDRAHGPRRPDQRPRFPGLCRSGAGAELWPGRRRHHGQSRIRHKGAGVRHAIENGRRDPALPPALYPGLQPHRKCLRQAQGAACERPLSEPWKASGPKSETFFPPSAHPNAPTLSQPQDTTLHERILL